MRLTFTHTSDFPNAVDRVPTPTFARDRHNQPIFRYVHDDRARRARTCRDCHWSTTQTAALSNPKSEPGASIVKPQAATSEVSTTLERARSRLTRRATNRSSRSAAI